MFFKVLHHGLEHLLLCLCRHLSEHTHRVCCPKYIWVGYRKAFFFDLRSWLSKTFWSDYFYGTFWDCHRLVPISILFIFREFFKSFIWFRFLISLNLIFTHFCSFTFPHSTLGFIRLSFKTGSSVKL